MEINSADLQRIYSEAPRTASRLDSAYNYESKTRQFPFVVAIELPSAESPTSQSPNSNQNKSPVEQSNDVALLNLIKAAMKGNIMEVGSNKDDGAGDDGISIHAHRHREFYVFHDIEHFLNLKQHYIYAHEIIRCPVSSERDALGNKIYLDENSRGRLLFDIDLTEPLPEVAWTANLNGAVRNTESYVPPDFRYIFECLIRQTFIDYYVGVDIGKFVFVWQNSHSTTKLSLHLIVKNAFFSEHWTKQMRVFYALFRRTALKYGKESYMNAIDFAMARRNATFRMLGSSKFGGNPLEIEHCHYQGVDLLDYPQNAQITMYDCLVGIYHHEQLLQEQLIELDSVNFNQIENELAAIRSSGKETETEKAFRKTIGRQFPSLNEEAAPVDVSDEDISRAVGIFQGWNDNIFSIRDQRGSVINLNRCRRGACPISGKVHDSENAYLKLRADGQMVFGCYRGCKNAHGHYYLSLGVYKPKEIHAATGQEVAKMRSLKGIVPLNMSKIKLVQATTTQMSTINPITGKQYVPPPPESETKKKSSDTRRKKFMKTSAKRITMSTEIVYLPNNIRDLLSKSH
jgi:hypothetical protein